MSCSAIKTDCNVVWADARKHAATVDILVGNVPEHRVQGEDSYRQSGGDGRRSS